MKALTYPALPGDIFLNCLKLISWPASSFQSRSDKVRILGTKVSAQVGDTNGEIIIGISVLCVAFILMPLFIYHRYKGKDLSNFILNDCM